jgi:hypothetical protein
MKGHVREPAPALNAVNAAFVAVVSATRTVNESTDNWFLGLPFWSNCRPKWVRFVISACRSTPLNHMKHMRPS